MELNSQSPERSIGLDANNHNLASLKALATRLDRSFVLPLPYAPGAHFFGAMVQPRAFGLPRHRSVGVAGRGLSQDQAFASCMGEAAEYLSYIERDNDPLVECDYAPPDLTQGELDWALAALGASADQDLAELDWIEAVRLEDGVTVRFPSELVLRRPEECRQTRRQAESNGAGAGVCLEDAILSGLMETVERDAIALWWYGKRPSRRVSDVALAKTDLSAMALAVRGENCDRPHWLLDLDSETGIPAIAAVSAFEDGSAAIAGFAAHPVPERAAQKAFLEMCQMELAQHLALFKRTAGDEDGLTDLDRVWIRRHAELSTTAFPALLGEASRPSHWPLRADASLNHSVETLRNRGFSAYYVDLTRPGIDIPVVKVVVPGLQSAKPDWISARLKNALRSSNVKKEELSGMISPI